MVENNEFLCFWRVFYSWVMANPNERNPENAPGRFYVDDSCVDCDTCRSLAPDFFRREDDRGYSVVYRQPVTPEEVAAAEEAMRDCPTDSIGDDGAPVVL
jgi:ferredoxin